MSEQFKKACLELRVYKNWETLPLSRDEWNEIVCSSATDTIFQTYEWHDAWWKVFGPGKSLHLLVAYKYGHPVALAPLFGVDGVRNSALRFLGSGHADYLDVICPASYNADFLATVLLHMDTTQPARGVLELQNIPSESPSNDSLANQRSGYRSLNYAQVPCPTLRITGNEDDVRRLLSRYSLRRPQNYFQRAGKLEYTELSGAGDVYDHLQSFFKQHTQRWKAKGVQSRFLESANREFFEELVPRLQPRGWLQFSTTTLDGLPLAYHFGFTYKDRLLWYKPSFESAHEKGSPGLLMLRQLIETALSTGIGELDFTIGDEAFKQRFANDCRTNLYWRVYRSRLRFLAAHIQHVVRSSRKQFGSIVHIAKLRLSSRTKTA